MRTNGLSLDQIEDGVLAALPAIREGVEVEQTLPEYCGLNELLPAAQSVDVSNNTYGDSIVLRTPQGTTHKHEAYGRHPASHGNYTERKYVTMAKRVNTGLSIDKLEDELIDNVDAKQKLFSLLKVREGQRNMAVAEEKERDIWAVPPTTSDINNEFLGPAYWFGRSCDSSGTFVAQTSPAYVGKYWRSQAGTASSVFGNLDASPTANEKWRSMLFTHSGRVDETFLRNFATGLKEQNFMRLAKIHGRMETPQFAVFAGTELEQQICDYANTQGPEDGDVYPKRVARIMGEAVSRCKSLDDDVAMPIYCINKRVLKLLKGNNLYDKDVEPERSGTTALNFPFLWVWQMFADSRRRMGFCAHADW